jgi:hypothetical protein
MLGSIDDSDDRIGFCNGFLVSVNISDGSMKLLMSQPPADTAAAVSAAAVASDRNPFRRERSTVPRPSLPRPSFPRWLSPTGRKVDSFL